VVINIYDFLNDFSEEKRDIIYNRILQTGKINTFSRGEIIVIEDEKSDSVYILLKGTVEVKKNISLGTNVRLALLKEGTIIGEMGVFLNLRRSATIVANTDIEVLKITNLSFLDLISRMPDLTIRFLKEYASKIDDLNTKIAKMTDTNILILLASYILDKKLSDKSAGYVKINITDLLQQTKLKREQISLGLKEMEKIKIVEISEIDSNNLNCIVDEKKILSFLKVITHSW